MSGKRLGSFRSGDRSEYLALFGLTRVAFVNPVPRQEDFGVVDFLCVLANDQGRNVYPESAFYVQVKSSSDVAPLDGDALRWISQHMDHPLFICVSDKGTSTLSFYSCARIWLALFRCASPQSMTLKLGSNSPPEHYIMNEAADRTTFEVHLGPPILQRSIADLEENPGNAGEVLDAWIRMDVDNIARRRLGRIAVRCFWDWKTNVIPETCFLNRYYHGPNYAVAEAAVVPTLIALGHNYIRWKQHEKLAALRGMLQAFYPMLDEHGRSLADGTLGIE